MQQGQLVLFSESRLYNFVPQTVLEQHNYLCVWSLGKGECAEYLGQRVGVEGSYNAIGIWQVIAHMYMWLFLTQLYLGCWVLNLVGRSFYGTCFKATGRSMKWITHFTLGVHVCLTILQKKMIFFFFDKESKIYKRRGGKLQVYRGYTKQQTPQKAKKTASLTIP